MRNLKISFQNEETKVKYEEYFFNGIQIPKDIEFKDISSYSFKLLWKIDNINILNIDNKQIKFKVEIRKENENEKFINVYEGNNSNCLIDNLNENTNYEIRICCIYNDLIGSWSPIQKIKTSDFSSIILNECKNKNEFLQKILQWSGCQKLQLLYRGSRDGTTSTIFHNKCDNKGETICLYKNEKGYIFGGYASIPWTSDGKYHTAKNSFIFTLTNIHNTEPTKFELYKNEEHHAVEHALKYGPKFGNDIKINEDFINKESYSNFPHNYEDTLKKGKSIFTGDLNNSNQLFKIKDIEVFRLIK